MKRRSRSKRPDRSSPTSRVVVVDASVARMAGTSTGKETRCCRETLDRILEVYHRLALSDAIKEEWNKHQSTYASRWRSTMATKGKVVRVDPRALESLDRYLDRDDTPASVADPIRKDQHLVEVGLGADRIVISSDRKVRSLLDVIARDHVPDLRELHWINPITDNEEGALDWLTAGAPDDPARQLGGPAPPGEADA
jgi:hypothetical protein